MGLKRFVKSVVRTVTGSAIARALLPAVAGPLGVALSVAGTALAVRDVVRSLRPESAGLTVVPAAPVVALPLVTHTNLTPIQFGRGIRGANDMSLLGGITTAIRQIGRRARSAVGLPVSAGGLASIGAAGTSIVEAARTVGRGAVGAVRRNLPGIAGGVAVGAATSMLFDENGNPVRRRRRGRGFSSRDIRQTRRMMRLIRDMMRLAPRPRGTHLHHMTHH